MLSYIEAKGFMKIDQILDEKACITYKFYITRDSMQKCLRHRCNDDVILNEFNCELWSKIKEDVRKPKKWPSQLTRHVRNHVSTAKNTPGKSEGEYKESLLEKYSIKPDTCTTYSKIRTATGNIECWRKNCNDEFSVRVQCKLFDGVNSSNRDILYKKRRHHGKA
ncbi:unnamed protein product [Caenorhabditis sp. 36 PRJEB53466]|nr:unnamed protein product [Caenorhabditis sp. 36 PRJEB53466]